MEIPTIYFKMLNLIFSQSFEVEFGMIKVCSLRSSQSSQMFDRGRVKNSKYTSWSLPSGCLNENSYLTSNSFPDLNAYEYRLPFKNLDLIIFPKIKFFEGWKCNDFIKIF